MNGWNVDWRQLKAGRARYRIRVIASQRSAIQSFHFSSSMHQRGAAPTDMVAFGFGYPGCAVNLAGREISRPALDLNGPNGFELVTGSEFRGISISFEREHFFWTARQLGLPEHEIASGAFPFRSSRNDPEFVHFGAYLRELFGRLINEPGPVVSRGATEELDAELLYRLLTALDNSPPEKNRLRFRTRQKRMRAAVDFIEANARENPSVPEICTAVGVSARSLDRAFKEYFAIGPKRYLLNFRLTQVHKQLKVAPPATKVSNVANDWSFWHMGDFSHEYRQLFGKYPSETLSR